MQGEPFILSLGADDSINITRKLINRFVEDIGIGNRSKRITYDILVTVTNFKTTPEQVRFRETVPVSQNERVVVRMIAPQEREIGTQQNLREVIREVDGKLTWRLNLQPGEKREIPLKYSIEFPADVVVSGLQ